MIPPPLPDPLSPRSRSNRRTVRVAGTRHRVHRFHVGGVAAVLLGLAACGGIDEPGPYTVTVTGRADRTALIAFRDGSGPWQNLTLDAAGEARFEVTAGYHSLAFACGVATAAPTALTVSHGTDTDRTVRTCTTAVLGRQISGTVEPAEADVWVAYRGPVLHEAGTYQVPVSDGARVDVVATAGGRMQIVRDVVGDSDRVVDLAVSTEGFPLPRVPLQVTGATGGVTTYAEILTANQTWVNLSGNAAGVPLVPAAQRIAGDRVVVGAQDASGRLVQRELAGDAVVALPLPAALSPEVTRAGGEVSSDWPRFSAVLSVRRGQFGRLSVSQGGDPAWIERSGTVALAWLEPASIPGWDPAWGTFMAGEEVAWSLRATRGAIAGDFEAVWSTGNLTW